MKFYFKDLEREIHVETDNDMIVYVDEGSIELGEWEAE